jgi:integrase
VGRFVTSFRRYLSEAFRSRHGAIVVARPASGSVRRMGKGWQVRVTHLGRRVAVGTFATRHEAVDALTAARSQAHDGRFVASNASGVSFESVVERWWQTREGHRPSTRARDRTVLDHDVLPEPPDPQLVEITHEVVQEWANKLATRLAPSSVQRSFTVLRQVLDFATRALSVNPSDRTRLPRRQRFEARFLTVDELELLESTIEARFRAMVLLMAWAILRIGEAIGLRRSDLDLHTGRLRVANNVVEVAGKLHEGPPKTKAGLRSMTLPPSIVAELRLHVARFGGSHYVFTTTSGGLLRAEEWRVNVWRPAVAAAGLAPLRPHDLKHTGVALLAAAGVDPMEIARRAGHSSGAFAFDRYGHLFPEADTGAAAKLDAIRTAPASTGEGALG